LVWDNCVVEDDVMQMEVTFEKLTDENFLNLKKLFPCCEPSLVNLIDRKQIQLRLFQLNLKD
jgi:hypothetical protein